jgi:U3 small nucleolar ribonucleoprotein component
MANTFHRMGADVYFAGYKVAILRGDVPATILDEVEAALDAYDPDAVNPEDHNAVKEDADRVPYFEREIAQLNGQIITLEAALKIASKRGKL